MLIETLKVFCDAVDLKSFSKAAEANYVTQSSVSQQIKKLEKEWKAALIERANRDMALTREGEIVYKEAKSVLKHYEAIGQTLGKTPQTVNGTVRLAAILGVGLHELPPYIKQFIHQYPQVDVRLDYMYHDKVYESVLKKRADLGVVAFPTPRIGIRILPFRNDPLAIVCHPRHPLARKKSIEISKINGLNFVTFQTGYPTGDAVEEFLRSRRVTVKTIMRFNNIEMIKGAVEIDAGISILPVVSVQNELKHRTLKAVKIAGKPLMRTLGIILRGESVLPEAALKFVEILRQGRN
ncbi:MAG: hypothetical protein A2901_04055 [Elusimicrobia bacterium RIFCSPLOWO2_01_FULL_54_10]|nr:MAG: hypothetical protein A2901_04055 [Elusimicrobia bacterium RIFCSPLOWO2_01_FULL_54_10]